MAQERWRIFELNAVFQCCTRQVDQTSEIYDEDL